MQIQRCIVCQNGMANLYVEHSSRKIIMKSASSESNLLLMSKLAQFDVLHGACRHQKHGHEVESIQMGGFLDTFANTLMGSLLQDPKSKYR